MLVDMIYSGHKDFPWRELEWLMRNEEVINPQLEDGYPPPEEINFHLEYDSHYHIWLARLDPDPIGYVVCEQRSPWWSEIHVGFVRGVGGRVKKGAIYYLLNMAFGPLQQVKVSAILPRFNRPARYLAWQCGFRYEGTIPNSWLRNGRLHDRLVYGVDKDAFLVRLSTQGAKCSDHSPEPTRSDPADG